MKKRKNKSIKVYGYKIRERSPGCWVLQVRRGGNSEEAKKHWIFETFHSEEAATLHCQQLHQEETRGGLEAMQLTTKARTDATEAAEVLNGRISLADAARFWVRHNPDGGAVTVNELVAQYMADAERRKQRKTTISDKKIRLAKFAGDYGDRAAVGITPENISEWLTNRGQGAVNSNNCRKVFNGMFSFALKRRIIETNPVAAVDRSPVDATMPKNWNAEQVEALMRAAQSFAPAMVPLVAVMAFAGLRPDEAAQLSWRDVNLSERIIRVIPVTSKKRKQSRIVEISDNLALWLARVKKKTGNIAPLKATVKRWRPRLAAVVVLGVGPVAKRLAMQKGKKGTAIKAEGLGWDSIVEDAKKEAGGELWPTDILRHSCATAWLAAHSDIFKLAEMLGNSPTVIRAHYKGLMTAKEAAAYWNITPEKSGKVIRLARTA